MHRTPKAFLDHLIDKFNLPAKLKQTAVLVNEKTDRVIADLSHVFQNDQLLIMAVNNLT
jgi:hypothetical protein